METIITIQSIYFAGILIGWFYAWGAGLIHPFKVFGVSDVQEFRFLNWLCGRWC
jgi:hypothetical protein